MGQSPSSPSRSTSIYSRTFLVPPTPTKPASPSIETFLSLPSSSDVSHRDHIADIPDEVLALIFQCLGSGERKRCSLVCRRWLIVEGQSRHRLTLDARAALLGAAPALFARFDSVSKLALKCDRRSGSIGDAAIAIIAGRCPNLTRLKLRACRELSEAGMAVLAKHCPNLRKLSCGSCTFGACGIDALLRGCPHLEELSIKRLRGLNEASGGVDSIGIGPGVAASSLRSICLKELYNGQCFGPVIAGSPNLKTLKLFRCAGDWDLLLAEVAERVPGLVEIHLEKLQVSDRGLFALSACKDLEVLHLVKTPECTNAGLVVVAESCVLLRKIHIDGWKTKRIGDEGLMAVARRCPNLQELVLIGVNPTSLSLELIASNCRNLERLALCGSETFGDKEISCIAEKCLALKKLCIKGCPVSDHGMEALAEGCPSLVKVKVKKCKGITLQGADWLRATRGSLAVNLDNVYEVEQQDAIINERGVIDNGVEEPEVLVNTVNISDIPSSSNSRTGHWKRVGSILGRNFFTSTVRRWSHGNSNSHNSL